MNLEKTLSVKELISSLSLLKKNAFWLVIAALIDAVFFLAYGFFTGSVSRKISEHAILLSNKLSPLLAEQHAQKGVLELLIGPELRAMTGKLVILVLILFAITYVLYCIFHGTSWWMATKIAEKETSYHTYLIGFAKVNLIWLAGYILFKVLDVFISLRYLLIQKILPNETNTAGYVLFAFLIVLSLAAFFSYPTLKARTLFKTPIKLSVQLVILCAAFFIIAYTLPMTIARLLHGEQIALIVGLIILFPTIILIKVYATRVLYVHTHT